MTKSKILIIDDDAFICKVLTMRFEKAGYECHCSQNLKQGLDKILTNGFDVLFLDINLPDGNGLHAIDNIREHPDPPEIIIMTGASDPKGAELAMQSRAWDYIQKSGSHKGFQFSLLRALEYRAQKQSKSQTKTIKRDSIVGTSRQITACLEKVSKASNNDTPVLITGETGTGKELFARAIHENSNRNKNDFIVVDCAALPEHLVESVLFGHSKGAFTSADSNKTGLLKLADKGTLFLDEVGELPIVIQKKFLRALQEKKFRPLGSKKEVSSNFRLVSATHRDLLTMIAQNQFREDFYFRIASLTIGLPPLKSRQSDIALLVQRHMDRKKQLFDESPHKISDEFMENLQGYNWPGNVRELLNTIDYACSDAFKESTLFPKHLPSHIRAFNLKNKIKKQDYTTTKHSFCKKSLPAPVETHNLKNYIEKMKIKYVTDLMLHTNNNIKKSCSLSGLSRGHLYALLKEYDIRH
jgi:two-component system, NtrC family, response regulator